MPGFYIKCKIENPTNRTRSAVLEKLLVDTGSEFTWVSEKALERIGIKPEKKDVGPFWPTASTSPVAWALPLFG